MRDHPHNDVPTAAEIRQMETRDMRWRLLRTLYSARGMGTNEQVLGRCLAGMDYKVIPQTVRNELLYLEGRGLIHIEQSRIWFAEITPAGVDVVEYSTECPAGISRPEQW